MTMEWTSAKYRPVTLSLLVLGLLAFQAVSPSLARQSASEITISGVVSDESSGQPIEGVAVRFWRYPYANSRQQSARTDANGRYTFEPVSISEADLITITISSLGWSRQKTQRSGAELLENPEVNFSLQDIGPIAGDIGWWPLAGKVIDAQTGLPVEGAQVHLTYLSMAGAGNPEQTVFTDAEGQAAFDLVFIHDTDLVILDVTHTGYAPLEIRTSGLEATYTTAIQMELAADELCPLIVSRAVEIVDRVCAGTGRNQACYGNITLLAEPREGAESFTFDAPGHLVDVASVQTLALSSYNRDAEEWGVSLMQLQANLPETLPGQNVTFVLFGDVEIENAVEPAADGEDPEAALTPFQAFFFRSGLSDAACSVAPDSGIEIQSPQGAGEIELTVNEVQITLASTLYLQAQAGGEMFVNVVEGQATVESFGVAQTVPAGARVRVPLDNDLRASGPPTPPEPYDEGRLQTLPISLLPQTVAIAPALAQEEIEAAPSANLPTPGMWQWELVSAVCTATNEAITALTSSQNSVTIEDDGEALTWGAIRFERTGPNIFLSERSDGDFFYHTTVEVHSSSLMTMTNTVELGSTFDCAQERIIGTMNLATAE